MKINIYKSLPLLSFLFVACSTEDITSENVVVEENSSEIRHITFSAGVEADNSTRAVSDANGYVNWVGTDKIKVFNRFYASGDNVSGEFAITQNKNNEYPYSFSGINAFFEGKINVSTSYTNEICAVYPSSGFDVNYSTSTGLVPSASNFTVNSVTATATLPSRQKLSSMSSDYQFMTARTSLPKNATVGALKFYNVISWIKINVNSSKDFPISRIKIVANSTNFASAQIAGKFTVEVDKNGVPSISSITNGSTFVEAYNEDYSTLDDGDYYFAVLPSAASKGLTILLEDVKGNKAYQRVNTTFKFERNNIYDLGSYDMSTDNIKSKILTDVVDLGLPSGTLWSRFNISEGSAETGSSNKPTFVSDATTPGGFYAWAEIATKENYAWGSSYQNYKYGRGASFTVLPSWVTGNSRENYFNTTAQGYLSRYNSSASYQTRWFDNDANTPPDDQVTLASDDDVANLVNNRYCIPTWNQANELLKGGKTTISKSGNNYVVTGVGNYKNISIISINLPASGWMDETVNKDTEGAFYWTCDRSSDRDIYSYKANSFDITSTTDYRGNITISSSIEGQDRQEGRLIRPVVVNANIRVMKTYNQLTGR